LIKKFNKKLQRNKIAEAFYFLEYEATFTIYKKLRLGGDWLLFDKRLRLIIGFG